MPIVSEVWQDAGLFLQRIDSNIFDNISEKMKDNNKKHEDANGSSVTNFIACLPNSNHNQSNEYMNIEIESYIETTVDLVGLQVWRGALFLADYIIMHPSLLSNKNVIELAAGTGLTSIAALLSNQTGTREGISSLICTDVDRGSILPLIVRNFERNSIATSPNLPSGNKPLYAKVAEIDFFNEETYCGTIRNGEIGIKKGSCTKTRSETIQHKVGNQTRLSVDELQNMDIILAADVVYDQSITKAFFTCLRNITTTALSIKQSTRDHTHKARKAVQIFISIEKRCRVSALEDEVKFVDTALECKKEDNVTNTDDVTKARAPNFDIFKTLLNSFINYYNNDDFVCTLQNVRSSEIIQSFSCYERVKELCLFKVTVCQRHSL